MNGRAIAYALTAAALFGLSAPVAKLLIGTTDPWVLAGLLYLGAGVGLGAILLLQPTRRQHEAPVSRKDLPWLAGAVFFGGIVGPVLLMIGLSRTDGATASLLLTMEGVATALIAWFVFHESFDRRILLGMLCIVSGAVLLSWQGEAGSNLTLGSAAVIGACVAWGLDNSLTRKVSLSDPIQIAAIKGLVAGPVTLTLAFAFGAPLPPLDSAAAAGLVGFLGYGISLVLFVFALRHLGTARTGAYFSIAPFIGAASAIPLLGETASPQLLGAGLLMAIGVWLHLTERHEHVHGHPIQEHMHRHIHDDHHRHEHPVGMEAAEPHNHGHKHMEPKHSHPHMPDAHHHHSH